MGVEYFDLDVVYKDTQLPLLLKIEEQNWMIVPLFMALN